MSIPSRVLISSNLKMQFYSTISIQCQSLQGFSYLLTNLNRFSSLLWNFLCQSLQGFSYLLTGLPKYLTRLLGRCQSLQGFSYLLTSIFILSSVSNCKCQSLQGFSYLLTGNELVVRIPADMVSIPSRVLISSNILKLIVK